MSIKSFSASLLGLFFYFVSCSHPEEKQKFPAGSSGLSLFCLPQIGEIIESPLNSPEVFDRNTLRRLGIENVCFYSKGDENQLDTLEKLIFSYSDNWRTLNFQVREFSENPILWTRGTIRINDDLTGSSTFSRYYGIEKIALTNFVVSGNNYLIIRNKNKGKKDTTLIYGSYNDPKAVIKLIGSKILSVELFMKTGNSSKAVKKAFSKLGLANDALAFAQCSVTFMEKQQPVESYLLNENFSQVNLLKNWKYNDAGRILEYNEWNGMTLLKNIVFNYSDKDIPDSFSINSRLYFVEYN